MPTLNGGGGRGRTLFQINGFGGICPNTSENDCSVLAMTKELDWDTLETRRKHMRLCMMYKLSCGLLNLNTENMLENIRLNIEYLKLCKWNSLPKELVLSETLDTFKSELKNFIK